MNTLMNINPWSFLEDVLDTNSRTLKAIRARASGRFPPVNVLMDDNAIVVDVELPGKTAAEIDLTLEPQSVTIADKPAEGECAWRRRRELPFRVNAEKASAKFTNGILRIELPKADEAARHRIMISD